MSRSNPTAKNPATRFFKWAGGFDGGGQLTWYDKEAEQEKSMKLPFTFLVLDELNTITGFSEADHGGFWSNEVRNLTTDDLIVRTSSGIKARGLYGQISEGIKAKGAKYAKSVYIAFKDEAGELVIGNIKVSGAALTAWIEFNKKFDVYKCAVILEGAKEAKKGANKYFVPIFDGRNVSEATNQEAAHLDETLQAYLSNYMARKPEVSDSEVVDDGPKEVEIEELPPAEEESVEEVTAAPKPAAKASAKTAPEEDDQVNLKDVPF
jgi:hypothetical protein